MIPGVDLATLEAIGRVHFCSRFDLLEKLKNLLKARKKNGEKSVKRSIKVWCESQVRIYELTSSFFIEKSDRSFSLQKWNRKVNKKVNNPFSNAKESGLEPFFERIEPLRLMKNRNQCIGTMSFELPEDFIKCIWVLTPKTKTQKPTLVGDSKTFLLGSMDSVPNINSNRAFIAQISYQSSVSHKTCRLHHLDLLDLLQNECSRIKASTHLLSVYEHLSNSNSVHIASGYHALNTHTQKCTRNLSESGTLNTSYLSNLFRTKSPRVTRSGRHQRAIVILKQSQAGDIEPHPGPEPNPGTTSATLDHGRSTFNLSVTSYNVRGLNDEKKLRHLLNYCYGTLRGKDVDSIYAFQETYVAQAGKIPFIWRGNYHLTPGEGSSCGCLTLLSSHINVVESIELANRGHVLACQRTGELIPFLIFANIYAPNPNVNEKISFFESIFEAINGLVEKYGTKTLLIAGDFNLIFKRNELKNRIFSAQERRIANYVIDCAKTYGMSDLWEKEPLFTWHRANSDTFSTIDRILFTNETVSVVQKKVNWSLSMSDHGAVEANFIFNAAKNASRSKITRLDPALLKNPETREAISSEFREMLSILDPTWNPHLKLEYAKMCLRTVVEKVQAEQKRKERSEEDYLNEELNLAINSLANSQSPDQSNRLIDYIEELRTQKAEIIECKGRRLAEKLGTKWYNDGEKSNKYFLRLLNRSAPDSFTCLEGSDGDLIVGETEIEKMIVDFYKDLYENYDKSNLNLVTDDGFFDNIGSLSGEDELSITSPITTEELRTTLASCKDSAPGPDGISYSYILTYWDIFGKLLTDAWNHSLVVGKLPPSHKVSFLKLIPKLGKNLKQLTNWRPITLSNCDHKIITKTYANRLCARMAKVINERQTAYLKKRLINDNIRAIIATVDVANVEENVDAILVSLDAKKAFDSVEHSFIKECLSRFGLASFCGIFDLLYSELRSDIIINGKIVNGFRTLRGVKQGDALSCILFIMCMEPLLCNIAANNRIKCIRSARAGDLPKIYAYADDVNGLILNERDSLNEMFREYERLTNKSGLELNADKTEILPFSSEGFIEKDFEINYLNKRHIVTAKKEIKVNGVLLQQNFEAMQNSNVLLVKGKMESQLRKWSTRQLTLLGKILLLKTYGISQIVFLMQSMILNQCHFKSLNEILYRFLWNRNFLAAKAPDRIKREIINTPITEGGLGMLDISELDDSLKLRAFGRLKDTAHPFLIKVLNDLDQSNYFDLKSKNSLEKISMKGAALVSIDRQRLLHEPGLTNNKRYVEILKGLSIKLILNRAGLSSIIYFNLRLQGKTKITQLNANEVKLLERFIDPALAAVLKEISGINLAPSNEDQSDTIFYKNRQFQISKLSSKEFRNLRTPSNPICIYKFGCVATPNEVRTWAMELKKVTSVRHRNLLLRIAHGEIYTNLKLFRYGLKDSPRCSRCNSIETLNHKFVDCPYVERIWKLVFELTDTLRVASEPNEEKCSKILGLVHCTNKILLGIHAEVLNRIITLKDDTNYVLHPKKIVQLALGLLIRREKNEEIKTAIAALLQRI